MGILAGSTAQKFFTVADILMYFMAGITGIVAIVKVDDRVNDLDIDIIDTCDNACNDSCSCTDNFNLFFAVAIIAFFVIVFAVVGLLADVGIDFFRNHLKILFFYAGRGVWMGSIGTMCLGLAGTLGLAVGSTSIILGGLLLLYGVLGNREAIA